MLGLLYFFTHYPMGAQGPHTSFISELAATTKASTCLPVSTPQGLLAQPAAVHREPHPEACVQFVSLELAGVFPCQCESSHHALDICWVLCFFVGFVLCFLCFVELEIEPRVTQRPHKRSATVCNNHALQPHSVPSPLIFFFPFSFF